MTDSKPPTTRTHVCVDGTTRPGGGKFDKDHRCQPCYGAYQKEWRHRRRDAKPRVEQSKLVRGGGLAIKHGFYRQKLDAQEAELAEKLHKAISEAYSLNADVDDMLLHQAVTNYVKSMRKEPPNPNDHSLRDVQSFYERQFREAIDALALSRRQRKEEGKPDTLAESLKALFPAKARVEVKGLPDDLQPKP